MLAQWNRGELRPAGLRRSLGHVPLAMRNVVVVDFWLLDFVGVEGQSMRRVEAQECWCSRVSECCVMLSMWPSDWKHTLGQLPSSCGPNTGI